MNKKITVVSVLILVIVGVVICILLNLETVRALSQKSVEIVEGAIGMRVNTSGPLRKEGDDAGSNLTVQGVIRETNRRRVEAGLPLLSENVLLDLSAQRKVDDMFKRQYFEHDAPTGESAGDLVVDAGYEFITVGENLALGNYQNDMILVQAWMDSPGHRENILKNSYTEIGVAVARGMFEGKETWLAVQHFAKPLSDCPAINANLKSQIDSHNSKIESMKSDLERRKIYLSEKPITQEEASDYNRQVDEFNALVNEYNALLSETRDFVSQYNSQIQDFNSCAKE